MNTMSNMYIPHSITLLTLIHLQTSFAKSTVLICPIGWNREGNGCVSESQDKKTWLSAKKWCRSLHPAATLEIAVSPEQLQATWTRFNGSAHWVGISDRLQKDVWKWENGAAFQGIIQICVDSNSPTTTKCVQIEHGIMEEANCHSRGHLLPFACSLSPPETAWVSATPVLSCPASWLPGKRKCFRMLPGPKARSYSQAEEQCREASPHSKLVSFCSREAVVMRVAAGTYKGTFWQKPTPPICTALALDRTAIRKIASSCHSSWHRVLCERPFCQPKCSCHSQLFEGRCNQLLPHTMSWSEAGRACRRLHPAARLATIRSQDEQDFLMTVAMPNGAPIAGAPDMPNGTTVSSAPDSNYRLHFWLGLVRSCAGDPWRWVDGSICPLCSRHWSWGRPQPVYGTLELLYGNVVVVPASSGAKYLALCQWSLC